jgi:hypothetical protein
MTDDRLDALRATVARHTGAARTRPLVELEQALADKYWRIGPGQPAGKPYLDEGIEALDEAYGHLEAGEFLRGQVAGHLGWLFGIRNAVHGGSDGDRERGIALLDEALSFPQQPRMMQDMARLILGQLLLGRMMRTMQAPDFAMRAMQSGLPREDVASADRAVACFRRILDGPPSNTEISMMAETMLTMAEAVQTISGMFGGGPGRMDLGRMMQALTSMQDLQQRATARPTGASAACPTSSTSRATRSRGPTPWTGRSPSSTGR